MTRPVVGQPATRCVVRRESNHRSFILAGSIASAMNLPAAERQVCSVRANVKLMRGFNQPKLHRSSARTSVARAVGGSQNFDSSVYFLAEWNSDVLRAARAAAANPYGVQPVLRLLL